jgi:hypothetical protein
LLETAGATAATWTKSVLRFLMERPGRAAEFASVLPPSAKFLMQAGWKVAEMQAVVARLLHDGTATTPLMHALIEREWMCESPSAACSATELVNLVFPPDVAEIGRRVFRNCSSMTHMEIPPSVTTIGGRAFAGCSCLTQVVIPASVTFIGNAAFEGSSRLTQVVIPASVMTLGNYVFHDCSPLTQVEIPSGFAIMGDHVFGGVTKIERLTLVGSPLSPSVVASLDGRLKSTAKVFGAALAGQRFGRFTIAIPE